MQPQISASDRQFKDFFGYLIKIATIVLMEHEKKEKKQKTTQFDLTHVDEDFIDTMHEEFLDAVFDVTNRMEREEWIKAVIYNATWILSAQGIRKKVKENLAKEGFVVKEVDATPTKGDSEAPQPGYDEAETTTPTHDGGVMPFQVADGAFIDDEGPMSPTKSMVTSTRKTDSSIKVSSPKKRGLILETDEDED